MKKISRLNKTRIEYLDYSRFFAIIGVIFVHTCNHSKYSYFLLESIAPIGRFGVQLFFIISGATIYLSYSSLLSRSSSPIKAFYIKRFYRIFPLFMIMGFYYSFTEHYNLYKILNPLSGLDPRYLNAIAGGWSIWNEMYFYLLFPIYFKFRNTTTNIIIFCVACLLFTNVIHFRIFELGSKEQMLDYDYLNIFNQLICFIIGVEYMAGNYRKILIIFSVYFFIGISLKAAFFNNSFWTADYGSSYFLALLSVLGVVFISILKFVFAKYLNLRNGLIPRLAAAVGKVTYTSYMVHFLVIEFLLKMKLMTLYAEVNFVLVAIITLSLGYLLKPITEDPFMRLGNRLAVKYM